MTFLFLCQVGEEDGDKTEATSKPEQNQNKTSIKNEEPVDLEKVVIKRREKKDDRKSTDGKDLIVKKPSSLISKLAKRKQTMSSSQLEEKEMTDQERSEIRKRCKAKVMFIKILNICLHLKYVTSMQKKRKLQRR